MVSLKESLDELRMMFTKEEKDDIDFYLWMENEIDMICRDCLKRYKFTSKNTLEKCEKCLKAHSMNGWETSPKKI